MKDPNAVAAKLTEEAVLEVIEKTNYMVLPGTTVTVCWLTLTNGFVVTGESACVRPEAFDEQLGKHFAYEHACQKVWAFEGYLMKQALHDAAMDEDKDVLDEEA